MPGAQERNRNDKSTSNQLQVVARLDEKNKFIYVYISDGYIMRRIRRKECKNHLGRRELNVDAIEMIRFCEVQMEIIMFVLVKVVASRGVCVLDVW